MKVNDTIHGFKVIRARESEELGGTLYELCHIRTGAALAWLDNKNDNKLFSVAFKTLPWDDTGVFHILEHSVLAGSEHYPVKEPFLDLLKSSMNTFLNAMTFPDKTMYPVSSRNEQDFINLTRVYLDAVFKPAIYHNESIFRQEGWHYEFNEDGEPFYNGVVFNEMKGALGSVDGLMERMITKYLYPDSIYGFESGGDPKAIPNLTYENFLRAHREFYSPAGAKIYLDGDVPFERVLKMMDEEYLNGDFEAKEHPLRYQQPMEARDMSAYYEIGKEEDERDKTQLVFAKVFASWEDRKRIMAYSLMASYLAGSNEAPLKRAVLEQGLAQNVEFNVLDGVAQPFYSVVFRNTDESKKEAIKRVYTDTLQKLLDGGMDKEELTANLNQFEFSLRDAEEPQGLIRNINALSSWLYGGDMLLYLENNALLAELRAALDTDYYEGILRELLDFSHTLTLTMLPSKTVGDEARVFEEQRVRGEVSAFSEDELAAVKATYEAMRAWQDTPDSPEAAATLPVLSLDDVSPEPQWTETEERVVSGVKVLFHRLPANGIVHGSLYFNAADEAQESLPALALLTELFGVLPTAKHTPSELQKAVKMTIGAMDFDVDVVPDKEDAAVCTPYFTVSFSVLEDKLDAALDLIAEILLTTDFDNKELIRENLLQCSENLYQSVMGAGHAYALRRALSHSSAMSAVQEKVKGLDLYRYLKEFIDGYDEKSADFIAYAKKRTAALFTASRLIISETAEAPHDACRALIAQLAAGSRGAQAMQSPAEPPVKEAILIPSGVSYAAYGANIQQYGYAYEGKLTVTALLLTYGYLWNEIRVHGGAYGCGFRAGTSGNATFHSYRDPHPLHSVEVYRNTADFIKGFVESDEPVEKYIISSIAATEALMSVAKQGYTADINYLSGITYEDKRETRTQMLTLKKEDLLALCPLFDKMRDGNSVCIVGNEEALGDLDGYTVYRL